MLIFLTVFAMALFSAPELAAQKSKKSKSKKEKSSSDDKKAKKQEEKKLQAELRAYMKNPSNFKAFKQAKEDAESENAQLKQEASRLKELESQCAKEVEGLRTEIEDLRNKLATAQQPTGFGIPSKGLYYAVQIGAFEKKDVSVNDNNPDFRKENTGGFAKYIMGVFPSIQEADELRRFLLELPYFKNKQSRPFVVPYRDGNRVTLEDALGPEEAERRKREMGGQ